VKIEKFQNNSVGWAILEVCVVIMALLSPCIAGADSESGAAQRLAILSSKEVQASGLSDLLTVQLQGLQGVGLVERDLLRKVFDEIALTMMLGADQTENRRKAGALLKADMLVLLSVEKAEDEKNVKMVISDCSSGARLRIGWVPFDRSKLDNTCRGLIRIVSETLERFRDGVKQIIGVSYFVSKNLIHDYDHLQAGYASLLGNALSMLPGTAVIEIEEARSIRHEEELAGDMQVDRVVPLLVEGEFRVQSPGSKRQGKIHMTIRLSDETGVIHQIDNNDLNMDKVAVFITDDVGQEILRLTKLPLLKMVDTEKQFAALVERASEFARVGAWKHSIALREAAVLVEPNSVEQRIQLIYEYGRVKKPRYGFEHLEYMIYNQTIPMGKAVALSRKCLLSLSRLFPFYVPSWVKSYRKDFLRRTYVAVLSLQPSRRDVRTQEYQVWYEVLNTQLLSCDNYDGCPDKNDLAFCLHLHENVLPNEARPSRAFVSFLHNHLKPRWRRRWSSGHSEPLFFKKNPEHFSEQDFIDFITAMSRSKKPMNYCYGRYALLHCEYYQRREQSEPMYDLYYEAVLLLDELEERKFHLLLGATKSVVKEIEQSFPKSRPQEDLDQKDSPDESIDRGKKQE
jgi:hypothetical protein